MRVFADTLRAVPIMGGPVRTTGGRTYGMMYGMKKTTIYLPDELKAALECAAAAEGCSEAELIRSAVAEKVQAVTPPRPRVPLWPEGFGDATIADRVDELLEGFGSA